MYDVSNELLFKYYNCKINFIKYIISGDLEFMNSTDA